MLKRLAAALVCLICLIAPALAETAMDVSAATGDLLAALTAADGESGAQAWLDGPLTRTAGQGGEWFVLALRQRGGLDFSAYRQALADYLSTATVPSASTRLKLALILTAVGGDGDTASALLTESAGKQGVMSHIFALHLLNNGVTAEGVTAEDTLAALLALQLADGGWAVTGQISDPDVTAMALQALAPYREQAAEAIDRAVGRLAALMRPGGVYASYGVPNAESAAQVIIALAALGIDCRTDGRFLLKGASPLDGLMHFRLPDGQFCHKADGAANANASAQALCALTALERLEDGKPGLYLLDPLQEPEAAADSSSSASKTPGWKVFAVGGVCLLALAVMGVLLIRKKRSPVNYIAVAVGAALLCGFLLLTDFQSPESYYDGSAPEKVDPIGTVTLQITCAAVAGTDGLPADGILLAPMAFPIAAKDTVYTLLTDAAQSCGLRLDVTGGAGTRYVRGVNGLYEFDHGDLSGWLYLVNGESPSEGCDQYRLQDGDVVEWRYTTDMGRSDP